MSRLKRFIFVSFCFRCLVWSSKSPCIFVRASKFDIFVCKTVRRPVLVLSDGFATSLTGKIWSYHNKKITIWSRWYFCVIWYVCETMLSSFTRKSFPWRFSFLKELKGALWCLLSRFGMLKWCLHINGNSKLVIKFVYCGRNNYTETVHRSLLLRMGRIEVDSILKNLASIFQKFRTHLKEKTKNVPWIALAKNWLMS